MATTALELNSRWYKVYTTNKLAKINIPGCINQHNAAME